MTRWALAAIFAVLLSSRMAHLKIVWVEEAYPAAAAIQILDSGKTLYKDIWFDKPVGTAYLYCLWGARTGLALRLADTLFLFTCCFLLYRFGRALWGRDLEGIVAEHAQGDDHPRLRVLHAVDLAAEGEALAGELAGADEVDLGAVGVAVGRVVDQDAEERDLGRLEVVLAGAEQAGDLALGEEHGALVGVDDGPGSPTDVDVGPLEHDLALGRVRLRDELATDLVMDESHGAYLPRTWVDPTTTTR